MIDNKKSKTGFPWSAVLFFGLITGVALVLDKTPLSPDHEPVLPSSENTSYQPFSSHPQYDFVLNLQKAFIRNAKTVGPSVVNISKVHEAIEHDAWEGMPTQEEKSWFLSMKSWFNKKLREKKYISETIGSGVIVDNSGHILTNYHVIKGIDQILVRLSDQRDFFAKVVGIDPKTDLAVLKINFFRSLPQSSFGSSQEAKVGQWVMTIGNPYGLQGTVTVGVISGIGRSDLGITTYENFIQTDASINPGNSGGPLIDLDGNIIGINTAVAAIGSGVGFAIPIEMALRIAEELIESGDVERGWLGVGIQKVTPELAASFKMPHLQSGVLVNEVADNTPAESGGIFRGDIIIQYDGKRVKNSINFQHMVADTQVGKKVPIKILRDGQEKTLFISVGKLIS